MGAAPMGRPNPATDTEQPDRRPTPPVATTTHPTTRQTPNRAATKLESERLRNLEDEAIVLRQPLWTLIPLDEDQLLVLQGGRQ